MTNLLTPTEGAAYLRTTADDALMLQLLPMVDKHVEQATGRDWTQDIAIHPTAKIAASILLASWYDDPGQMGTTPSNAYGPLVQLEAEALKYRKYVFYGRSGIGGVTISGALVGDEVQKLLGVYGVSGDQSAKFESVVSVADQIQQTDSGDLSENIYVVVLKAPADDIGA